MNNNHSQHFYPQGGFNSQNSITSQYQYPSRIINAGSNYQPAFNQNSQRPAFSRVPNTSNINIQPTPFRPPHSSFNTPQNNLEGVPTSRNNFLQPQTRVYCELNNKQSPIPAQNLNVSSTIISNSSTHITTTSGFPLNRVNYNPQAQTSSTSFQAKESYSGNFQGQINSVPPPFNLHIPRPPNMPPHVVNHQRTIMSSSYNPNFSMPPPLSGLPQTPPGMPPILPVLPPTPHGIPLTPPSMPPSQNLSSQLINKSSTHVNQLGSAVLPPLMPPSIPALFSQSQTVIPPTAVKPVLNKESLLSSFLEKFTCNEKKKPTDHLTVSQFRQILKQTLCLMKKLRICKENLAQLLQSDEKEWTSEVSKVMQYQNQLAQACDFLSMPKYLNCIRKKMKLIKKKRNSMKKLKQNVLNEKLKKTKAREQLNQEIDKWLDSIKEKNLKLKRETEMKKEADSILSEVRRKIQEAKRTIEKIKVFEKLRNTRQSNAAKKGLFLPEHDETFKSSVSNLKETVYRQLSHYESEEKALKVMLEAEQEGQLEEESKWKIKRMKTLQERRQKNIIESLFGDSAEEPDEDEPIYLFYQFQNSGNKSIENLVQIRHHWDMHVSESGEPVPLQWVVPVPPSSSGWEVALNS